MEEEEPMEKLSIEEQALVEEGYKVYGGYLKKNHMIPLKWWEEDLIFACINAIKTYVENEDLQKKYALSTIIFRNLDWARKNAYRKMNRQKRKPKNGLMYCDGYFFEIPAKVNIETEAISNTIVSDIFRRMDNERQRKIVRMLMAGCKKIDIEHYLDLSYCKLQKEIMAIQKIVRQVYAEKEMSAYI